MPRPCTICRHPERPAIEQAIQARGPYRQRAKRFGTSPAALYRHQQDHAQPQTSHPPTVPPEASALVAAAQPLHTTAQQSQRQFVDVRSLADPKLLWQVHALGDRLVEVAALLTTITATTAAPPRPPQVPAKSVAEVPHTLAASSASSPPALAASLWAQKVQRLHTAAGQVHKEALAANTIIATTLMLRRVTALVVDLTGVLAERGAVSLQTAHLPRSAAPLQRQPPELVALRWPQWHQEARALAEQLDKVFGAWSVPPPAQRVMRQMATLLVHMTSQAPEVAERREPHLAIEST